MSQQLPSFQLVSSLATAGAQPPAPAPDAQPAPDMTSVDLLLSVAKRVLSEEDALAPGDKVAGKRAASEHAEESVPASCVEEDEFPLVMPNDADAGLRAISKGHLAANKKRVESHGISGTAARLQLQKALFKAAPAELDALPKQLFFLAQEHLLACGKQATREAVVRAVHASGMTLLLVLVNTLFHGQGAAVAMSEFVLMMYTISVPATCVRVLLARYSGLAATTRDLSALTTEQKAELAKDPVGRARLAHPELFDSFYGALQTCLADVPLLLDSVDALDTPEKRVKLARGSYLAFVLFALIFYVETPTALKEAVKDLSAVTSFLSLRYNPGDKVGFYTKACQALRVAVRDAAAKMVRTETVKTVKRRKTVKPKVKRESESGSDSGSESGSDSGSESGSKSAGKSGSEQEFFSEPDTEDEDEEQEDEA